MLFGKRIQIPAIHPVKQRWFDLKDFRPAFIYIYLLSDGEPPKMPSLRVRALCSCAPHEIR
jgi:hypothetical protein